MKDIVQKIDMLIGESWESADKLHTAIDTVQQKIAAEDDPTEKKRLQERLVGLQQRWIEALRAAKNSSKK